MSLAYLFPWLAGSTLLSWFSGLALFRKHRSAGFLMVGLGCAGIAGFLGYIWLQMERPPLRTLGETRLWYALFLPVAAAGISLRWKMNWPLFYAVPLASLFLTITWLHPESWDRTLMPALRSAWFVPHVVSYLLAYAFLSAAFAASLRGWFARRSQPKQIEALAFADLSVQIGFSFLTLGLVIGAVWAKTAWGHYWTWDPKETWAMLTWLAYLAFLHFRLYRPQNMQAAFLFLSLAWLVLLVCWFGLNSMPIGGQSVHTYAR